MIVAVQARDAADVRRLAEAEPDGIARALLVRAAEQGAWRQAAKARGDRRPGMILRTAPAQARRTDRRLAPTERRPCSDS